MSNFNIQTGYSNTKYFYFIFYLFPCFENISHNNNNKNVTKNSLKFSKCTKFGIFIFNYFLFKNNQNSFDTENNKTKYCFQQQSKCNNINVMC